MTTSSSNNTCIADGVLILPLETYADMGTYNSTGHTNSNNTACSAIPNLSTKLVTGINTVQSARLTTLAKGSTTSIQYGHVEVRTSMPEGDWLWPAIWILDAACRQHVRKLSDIWLVGIVGSLAESLARTSSAYPRGSIGCQTSS